MTTPIKSVSTEYQDKLKSDLKSCARELLRQYVPGGPPYDPFLVARGLRVEVQETDLAGIEGYIETKDGKYVAAISTSARETRRRFTLAHELCHVLLMRKAEGGKPVRLIRFRSNGNLPGLHQDPVEESLCNYFAAELLMPSDEIRSRFFGRVVEPKTIMNLANDYHVSTQSAAIQIVRVLRERLIACSLWNLESLWPLPVWWTGYKTPDRVEVRKLEGLAERKTEQVELWQSYGGRRGRAQIMISPTPAMRFAMILIKRTEEVGNASRRLVAKL